MNLETEIPEGRDLHQEKLGSNKEYCVKKLTLFVFVFLVSACMRQSRLSGEYISEKGVDKKCVTVLVKGEVRTPGTIAVKDGASAWEVLQQCGGVNTNYASKNVVVRRKGKYMLMQWDCDEFKEFAIEDGDMIGVMSD